MNAAQLKILADVEDEDVRRAVYALLTASPEELKTACKIMPVFKSVISLAEVLQ